MSEAYILAENAGLNDKKKYIADNICMSLKRYFPDVEMINVEFGNEENKLEITGLLTRKKPKFIVTFDLAGFNWNTIMNEQVYNIFPAHKAHVILDIDTLDKREKYLERRLNFSDIVYLPSGAETEEYVKQYPEIVFFKASPIKYPDCYNNDFDKIVDQFLNDLGVL